MALVLDESFATGIPGSFATARAQAGTLAASWNSGAQAVDLSNTTAGQCIWDITSLPLTVAGEMELDLEFVADFSAPANYLAGGAWPVAGQAAVSNGFRFGHVLNYYECGPWSGGDSWAGWGASIQYPQGDSLPFNVADRRIFNVRWDMSAGAGSSRWSVEGRIDGTLGPSGTMVFPSLRPGVFLYHSSVRLHSIKVWDAPQVPLAPLVSRAFSGLLGRTNYAPPEAQDALGVRTNARMYVTRSGVPFDGIGHITGTVKEHGTPDVPVRRRVCLIEEQSRTFVRETWSDAITGVYIFPNVDMSRRYTVVGYDHTNTYRAVIADNQIPELMP